MASNQINHLSSFEKQLKSALKQYHAPETLGDESPLASYYFLGHLLTEADDASSAIKRGQLLQRELRLAADQLWTRPALQTEDDVKRAIKELSKKPDSDCYAYLILELRCFYRFIKPKRTSEIWENILPGSRAEHYRDYDRAIAKLARVFLQRIHPTFRLEQPAGTAALLGYSGQQQDAAAALAERKAVYLYGPGGTGKTALGALLAEAYPSERRFWFTIRPTFNDRLESLLFALGYFFHQHGASNLWHMLLINEGKVDNPELALGLVHEDLALIQDRSLLLCFDELEQLQVFDPERINPAHQQIVHFIENFRGRVALLLLGQRPFMMADSYVELRGLIAPDIARLFAQVGMKLGMDVVDRLAQHTAGNPRLLCLYRLLCEKGESLDLLLQSATPSAELYPLIQRLWNRLGWAERRILQELSVFRSMAPAEHWATEAAAIKRLADQGLLHWHGPGAVALVSAFRTAIYQELLPEAREALHTLAADIRIDRAEYTAAAYHLCRAGDEKGAIQLWYVHMTQEIQRGQAGSGLGHLYANLESSSGRTQPQLSGHNSG
ncbi:MAG: hypothetical protein R2932_55300 [Caldilineaceae bacterium]